MKHYTIQPIKSFVAAVQNSGLPNCTDAAVHLLEYGSATKRKLLQCLQTVKKRSTKDGKMHDFRIGGVDTDGSSWMLSYMVGSDTPETMHRFRKIVTEMYVKQPVDSYIAIFDASETGYKITEIVHNISNTQII